MPRQNQYLFIVVSILIGFLSRLLPHIPNVTALTSMSIILGIQLSRQTTLTIILLTLLGSDLALAYYFGYAVFGSWTFFTYAGYIAIGMFANTIQNSKIGGLLYLLSSTVGFWLWTNFGVWWLSGMYSKTFEGLLDCYTAALPFLRNGLSGDLAWMAVLLSTLWLTQTYSFLPRINRLRSQLDQAR